MKLFMSVYPCVDVRVKVRLSRSSETTCYCSCFPSARLVFLAHFLLVHLSFKKCCWADSSQSNNIQHLINTWPDQVLVVSFKFLNEFQKSAAETFFFPTALWQKQIRQNGSVLLPEARGNYSCFPVNPSIRTELQEKRWSNHSLWSHQVLLLLTKVHRSGNNYLENVYKFQTWYIVLQTLI